MKLVIQSTGTCALLALYPNSLQTQILSVLAMHLEELICKHCISLVPH